MARSITGLGRINFLLPDDPVYLSIHGFAVDTPLKRTILILLQVKNLSTRISWQTLKDYMRDAGFDPTYADAHREKDHEAVLHFSS